MKELLFFLDDKIFYDENGVLREEPEESLEELLKRYEESCRSFSDFKKREIEAAGKYAHFRWINNMEPVFIEDDKRNYAHRTWENAEWSDITLALAVDMESPGEITTRRAAGPRYIGVELPEDFSSRCLYPNPISKYAGSIAARIKSHPNFKREGMKLNIAGNSQITLDKHEIPTKRVRSLLRIVFNILKQYGVSFNVRSGGQTGVDEAAIQAAQDTGINCSILAPKGWRMHWEEGVELEGKEIFVERFREKVIDYEAWCHEDDDKSFGWGIADFNACGASEMLEYDIDLKIMHLNARERAEHKKDNDH